MSQALSNYDAVQTALDRAETVLRNSDTLTAAFVRRADKSIDPVSPLAKDIVAAINAHGGNSASTNTSSLESFVLTHAIRNPDKTIETPLNNGEKVIFVGKYSQLNAV